MRVPERNSCPEESGKAVVPPWRAVLHAYFEGATRSSWRALAVMVAVNALVLATALLVITEGFMVRHGAAWFGLNPRDYDVLVSTRALAMADAAAGQPLAVIAGASSTQAGILEGDFGRILALRLGRDIPVYKLCTSLQTLYDTAMLIEKIPAGSRGLVIMGVGPTMFTADLRNMHLRGHATRMAVRSEFYDEQLRAIGLPAAPRTGIYAVDNAGFLSVRLPWLARNLLLLRPIRYVESRYLGQKGASPEFVKRAGHHVREILDDYPARVGENMKVLERLVAMLRERTDMQLLLLDSPINPQFMRDNRLEPIFSAHNARMREFAQAHGLLYADANIVASLDAPAFFDWTHLRDPAAVERLTTWAAEQAAQAIGVQK